jgi:hypothetical protein
LLVEAIGFVLDVGYGSMRTRLAVAAVAGAFNLKVSSAEIKIESASIILL